ncbi:hypothetical protein GCM10010317_092620 [Streptomyces mirabilis]|jgi:hypothetical protein|uniref:aromatic prenyltransferase n=1 Tax=Streptomyces mirabilis TaxID=68239 RepID=UPI00167D9CAD|nr:hypothetical protein GCM10010317_092620 [Streptomyces mirabilis]
MNAVAWSFGSGSGTYIKAERSYCGDLISLIKGWNTFFSQSTPPIRRSRSEVTADDGYGDALGVRLLVGPLAHGDGSARAAGPFV